MVLGTFWFSTFWLQMQMVVAGGTPTWRALTMKKLGLVRYGKEWGPPLLGEL